MVIAPASTRRCTAAGCMTFICSEKLFQQFERELEMKKTVFALGVAAALAAQQVVAAQPGLEEKIDILQQEIETLKIQVAKGQAKGESASAMPADAGSGATTIGGYGEFAYNSYRNTDVYNNEADLRRFVLFVGHKYTEDLRFVSEMEIEHAVASSTDSGEVEVEQAYIDYQLSNAVKFKTGLFLMPLGMLNETHEPPTYYGVERNEVETRIIPTTWREGGVGVYGEVAEGLRYDIGITTGFNAAKIDDPAFGIRGGHQEMQLAQANDLSLYGAMNYLQPGVLLGGGIFTGKTGQNGASNPLLKGIGARLTLWDVHAKYSLGKLELQGLYARGTLGDADQVGAATGVAVPKLFYGWYTQAAYHLWKRGDMDLTPFYRYERYNTQAEVAEGFAADPLNDETVQTAGINFRLHPQVVIKADYQKFRSDTAKDRIDVGLGYMF